MPQLEIGTLVSTMAVPNPATDWTEDAHRRRRFGENGVVIARHDSHGECYDVQHTDGSVGCYEARELHVPQPLTTTPERTEQAKRIFEKLKEQPDLYKEVERLMSTHRAKQHILRR